MPLHIHWLSSSVLITRIVTKVVLGFCANIQLPGNDSADDSADNFTLVHITLVSSRCVGVRSSMAAPGAFTDDEFESCAKEIMEPDLEGWDFFLESMGFKFDRKYDEVLKLLSY